MKAIWLDTGEEIAGEELSGQGVHSQNLSTNPQAYQKELDRLMQERGYLTQDMVVLQSDMPNFQALCAKFLEEHLHTDDEVRFVLSGSGVFEIRSRDDRWMRITVQRGDLLVVPERRYHRFYLTDEKAIQCVRLFKDSAGWTPHYRKDLERELSLSR